MKDSKQLIKKVTSSRALSESEASPTTSPTEAGRADTLNCVSDEQIDTVNQLFGLFRVNYHNQYYAAFNNDNETINQTKKLWLDSLSRFTSEQILKAAKKVIEDSDYLPTLHKMITHCSQQSCGGLPSAHRAYIEACMAPPPKSAHAWSHTAVYHAGRETGWHLLANETERVAFPLFKHNYAMMKQRVVDGENLETPVTKAIPEQISTPLSKQERQARLLALKQQLAD